MDWKPIEVVIEGQGFDCHLAAHNGVWYIARTKEPLFCLRADTPDDAVLKVMSAIIAWRNDQPEDNPND